MNWLVSDHCEQSAISQHWQTYDLRETATEFGSARRVH